MSTFNANDFREDLAYYLQIHQIAETDLHLLVTDPTVNIMRFVNDPTYTLAPEHYKALCNKIGVLYEDYLVNLPSSRKSAEIIIKAHTNEIDTDKLNQTLIDVRRLLSDLSTSITVDIHYSSKKRQ